MSNNFSLWALWPKFETLLQADWDSNNLSALFVVILFVVFLTACCLSIRAYRRAKKRTDFLARQVLRGVTKDNLAEMKAEMDDRAKADSGLGHLWQEFSETLVLVEGEHGREFCNTHDAEFFFNIHTLATGATESRLALAIPGFLTAIGVLGTFVGLQMGLSDLNLSDEAELRNGISSMINGASVAFVTSVWGVFLSLGYNIIEKMSDQWVRGKIQAVQSQIDGLFPRITPEYQLAMIAEDGSESRKALQGLAEKIGARLQVTLEETTASFKNSLVGALNDIMRPAIDHLVTKTNEGNTEALASLLQKFMEGFGTQGREQRTAMEEAAAEMNKSLGVLGTSLNAFIRRLEQNQQESQSREKQLTEALTDNLNGLLTSLANRDQESQTREAGRDRAVQQQIESMSHASMLAVKHFNEAIANMEQGTGKALAIAESRFAEQARTQQETWQKQSEAVTRGIGELLGRIQILVDDQVAACSHLLEQGQTLRTGIVTSSQANIKAAGEMRDASQMLKTVSDNLNVFGSNIREAGNKLAGAVTGALEATRDMTDENARAYQRLELIHGRLSEVQDKLKETLAASDQIFKAMRQHQNDYLEALYNNVEALAEKVSELLNSYAREVQNQTVHRMEEWNTQTREYTIQMTSTVKALAGVLDDMEDKIDRRGRT